MNLDAEQTPPNVPADWALEDALKASFSMPLCLVKTTNRRRLVSYRRLRNRLEVRVSCYLLALGSRVVEPIVAFVRGEVGAREQLGLLFKEVTTPPVRKKRELTMTPLGDNYDLRAILARESLLAFGEEVDLPITWGPRRPLRPQRTIRLGSYDFERAFIRIHRRLDHPAVPEWFVGFVVFHELLHHRFGVAYSGGRRVIHSAEFRRAERRHPHFRAAQVWEIECLPRLLRRRRG